MRHILTQAGPFVVVYDSGSDRWSWQKLDWRTPHGLYKIAAKSR